MGFLDKAKKKAEEEAKKAAEATKKAGSKAVDETKKGGSKVSEEAKKVGHKHALRSLSFKTMFPTMIGITVAVGVAVFAIGWIAKGILNL